MREYDNFAKEVKKRGADIRRNYEYAPCNSVANPVLQKKTKVTKNNCKFREFGCAGLKGHKTNASKHCRYFGLCGAALDTAKSKYEKSMDSPSVDE